MKKIISIFLSLIVLISSTGLTLSTHYCMGRAVDTELMLGDHNLTCGMGDMDAVCETTGDMTSYMSTGCCDDDHLSIQIEDDYEKVTSKILFEKHFLYALVYTTIFNSQINCEQVIAYSEICPPPLEQDYQSLYQSFLL